MSSFAFFIKSLTIDKSTLTSSERLNDRRDISSNDTTTFENRDTIQVNVGRGWDLFGSYAFNESQRNSQDDTDCLQRLYQATDVILIICAVVINVSVFIFSATKTILEPNSMTLDYVLFCCLCIGSKGKLPKPLSHVK